MVAENKKNSYNIHDTLVVGISQIFELIFLLEEMMDNLKDSAISKNALEFIDDFLTPEERIKSDLRVAFIGELIKARQEKGLCQKKWKS